MRLVRKALLICVAVALLTQSTPTQIGYGKEKRARRSPKASAPVAPRPPMGWKSWDCYGLAVLASSLLTFAQQPASYDRLERAANLIRQQQLTSAEAELNAVMRVTPRDPNALNLLGVIRAQQKRDVEAEQLFLRALNESPAMVGPYLNLGRLYLEQQKNERALWAFTEASKLTPDSADINYNLASLYEEQSAYERALGYLAKIPRATWGVEQIYLAVKCDLSLGRTDEALAFVTPLARPSAVTADEAAGLAAVFLKHNLPDAAIQILSAAQQVVPDSYALLYQLGASYAQKREWSRAESFYTAALAAKPDDVMTLRELARMARARGELEKALAHLVRARKLAPDSLPVLYDFGLTALQMDLVLDALPAFERLQSLRPDEPAYLYMLAVTCYRHDEKARAEPLLVRYIKLRPNDAIGYYVLGEMLYTVKRYDEARTLLEQSLKLGAKVDSEFLLGMMADNEGDTEGALRRLKNVLEIAPQHAAAHTAVGTIYARQNKYELAGAELEQAIQLNARDMRAYYQLGLVYAKLGKKEQAQKMLDRADQLREEQRTQEIVGLKLIDPPQ